MIFLNSELIDNKFRINNFPLDNQRKLMKIKIFLNANKSLNYEFVNSDLEINFLLDDEILIAKEIKKFASYVESVFDVQLNFDFETEKNLQSFQFLLCHQT